LLSLSPNSATAKLLASKRTGRSEWSRVTRYKQEWQILGTGLFGHSFRSGFNQLCNSVWLRHVNRMAARCLDDCRNSALCHETLGRRWDHRSSLHPWLGPFSASGSVSPRQLSHRIRCVGHNTQTAVRPPSTASVTP